MGGGDDDECTRTIQDMDGIIAEIDEVDLKAAPKRKQGFFAKAIYPARPLTILCMRHFDCATDVMDGEIDVGAQSVRWLAAPGADKSKFGEQANVGVEDMGGCLLRRVQRLKALERQVNGTGNEGSEAYFLYRHAALLVPLRPDAEEQLKAFSHEHAQRSHPEYNP
eukprot:NODE_6438_length_1672_cov_9.165696.p3 GENE.NODE_6438_length_1672_cov_9.165696~~NODE_6438_length_1672_cov_9.165696.p3  ORF type:complete len:166 (-),score=42.40 NODE_6438_length_1672_cov_9.165696:258-755(-)